jgi:hypothetical protein
VNEGDVTEKVNFDEIHEPLWRPGFSPRGRLPVAPLAVVIEPAARRRTRFRFLAASSRFRSSRGALALVNYRLCLVGCVNRVKRPTI